MFTLLCWADTGTLWLTRPRTGMASSRFCKNFGSRGGSLRKRNTNQFKESDISQFKEIGFMTLALTLVLVVEHMK